MSPTSVPPGLSVVVHPDADVFLRRARSWLMEREDEHNLILGLSQGLAGTPPAPGADGYLMATVEKDGEVVGVVFRTPPYKVGVTRMPVEAAPLVAEALARRYEVIPAVFGPRDVARAVSGAWASLKGVSARPGKPQRMYRLDAVTSSRRVPGALRVARRADLPLVHTWADGFAADAGAAFATSAETRERWIAGGSLWLWEDAGEAVCMALATGRTPNGVRIGYVYTPPERRGRGYATGLVAALSQQELDAGARFCVLYTDLTNPVSNAIYPRVGYRPLCDLVDVELDGIN